MKVKVGEQEQTFETGKIGKQANGSVLLKVGETIFFLTPACATPTAAEDADFFSPLKVDYQEKFFSVGKTISGF